MKKGIYFKEERLTLTTPGESLVRIVTYATYLALIVAVPVLLFSEAPGFFWLGILLLFFLIDRLLHFGQAERSLDEVRGKRVNLAQYITPATYRALSYASRRSRVTGQSFYLLLLTELMGKRDVGRALTFS